MKYAQPIAYSKVVFTVVDHEVVDPHSQEYKRPVSDTSKIGP